MKVAAPIINIAFYGMALSWIMKLQDKECECSTNWRREYMKYFFMFMIIAQALLLSGAAKGTLHMVAGPMGLASLVYIYATITYVNELRAKQCSCADGVEESILYWMAVVQAALLAWVVFAHTQN